MIYLIIFILKFLENTISTLRFILISNGRKIIGAILQFICSIIFIISASLVIVNFNKDILKILAFAFGCAAGSYIGCVLEEKIAIGTNMIMCISEDKKLASKLRNIGYIVTVSSGIGLTKNKYILFIMVSRKKQKKLSNTIHRMDANAFIISETANPIEKK